MKTPLVRRHDVSRTKRYRVRFLEKDMAFETANGWKHGLQVREVGPTSATFEMIDVRHFATKDCDFAKFVLLYKVAESIPFSLEVRLELRIVVVLRA